MCPTATNLCCQNGHKKGRNSNTWPQKNWNQITMAQFTSEDGITLAAAMRAQYIIPTTFAIMQRTHPSMVGRGVCILSPRIPASEIENQPRQIFEHLQ